MNIRTSWVAAALIVGLVFLSIAPIAWAQAGISYQSSYQVKNLSSSTANITIYFYSQYLGRFLGTISESIAANSSKTYFPMSLPSQATAFDGSIKITSDQPIRTITNLMSSDGVYAGAAVAMNTGYTTFNLPLIMCNNSGFNTFFNVQNVGSSTASITINYIPGSAGVARTETATINVGAKKTFDQTQGSFIGTRDCSTLKDASGKFIGSAKITSNQPVIASVVELNTISFKPLFYYNGFISGSPTVALPLIMANNNGYYTSVQVQNIGSSSTTVTLTYSSNTGGSNNPVQEVFTLAAGVSKTIFQNGAPPSNGSANNWNNIGKYIGSASITNSGSQPLVAIVNQQSPGEGGLGPYGSAYEGFNPAAATQWASAPLIMSHNGGNYGYYYTSIQTKNVGTSACTVTITYGPNTGGSNNPVQEVFTLAAGDSKTIIQNGSPPQNGSANNWDAIDKYIGSATISGSTSSCKLNAIVNEQARDKRGDTLLTYDTFNY
jgi:hypothetical protein